jgi:hypothetical protein
VTTPVARNTVPKIAATKRKMFFMRRLPLRDPVYSRSVAASGSTQRCRETAVDPSLELHKP